MDQFLCLFLQICCPYRTKSFLQMSANYNSQKVPRVGIVVNGAKPPVNDPCPARDSIFVEKKTNTNIPPPTEYTLFTAIEIFRKELLHKKGDCPESRCCPYGAMDQFLCLFLQICCPYRTKSFLQMSANYNSQNVPRVGIVVNNAKPSVNDPCPARDNIFVRKEDKHKSIVP